MDTRRNLLLPQTFLTKLATVKCSAVISKGTELFEQRGAASKGEVGEMLKFSLLALF